MKKQKGKKYFGWILLIVSVVCLLVGCSSGDRGIKVETKLPENTELHFLLQCQPNKEPEHPETEIAKYNEDGFLCADIRLEGTSVDSYKLMFNQHVDSMQLIKYVQKYQHIRLAVTDKDGNILQVSPTFSLTIKHRNSYWDYIEYDYEMNEINGIDTSMIDNTHFWKMLKWTLISTVIAGFLWLIVATEKHEPFYVIILIIYEVPTVIMFYFQIEQLFFPYYRMHDWTVKDAFESMFFCDFFWNIFSLLLALKIYQRYVEYREGFWLKNLLSRK